jgi:hypothetical protein
VADRQAGKGSERDFRIRQGASRVAHRQSFGAGEAQKAACGEDRPERQVAERDLAERCQDLAPGVFLHGAMDEDGRERESGHGNQCMKAPEPG